MAQRNNDTFRLSLRGACLVAATDYARHFGGSMEEALAEADRMYERLKHCDMDAKAEGRS